MLIKLQIKLFLVTAFLFGSIIALSQPANDSCYNSTPVIIPGSGSICLTAQTNKFATADVSFPSCGGAATDPSVYYTYISNGIDNTITVTPSGGTPASGIKIEIASGSCALLNGLGCNSAAAGPVTVNVGIPAGTQVWVQVTTTIATGGFDICINSLNTPPAPGKTCALATRLCTKSNFTINPIPSGTNGQKPGCWGALSSLNRPSYFVFTVGQTGLLNWKATNTCGKLEFDWAVYDVTAGCPGTQIACNYNFAGDNALSFGMSGGPVATPYNAPSTGNAAGETSSGVTVTAGRTYYILIDQYTTSKNCGVDFSFAGSTFEIAPASTFALSSTAGCGSVTTTFTNNSVPVAGNTYTWNFGDGSPTSSVVTPPAHTYSNPGTYLISLKASNATCTDVSSASVQVYPIPHITNVTLTQTICTGGTASFVPTSDVPGSTFTWTASASSGAITGFSASGSGNISNVINNSGATPGTVTYVITPKGPAPGNCVGPTKSFVVTVNPVPTMTSASTATICSGGTVSIPLTSNVAASYTWIATDNPNTTGESTTTQSTNTLSNTITNTSTSVQTVTYTVTPTSTTGSCVGTTQTVTVTVNPKPTMSSASTATICSGTTVSIPLTSVVASSYTWIATDNVNTTGESTTTQSTSTLSNTITNTSTSVQTVTYTVTPTSTTGSCVGTTQTVTVTVNPTPTMSSASTATICSGGTVSIPLTSVVASSYTWIATDNVNTTGESITTQSTNTLSNTINNTSPSVQTVTYTVTPTSTAGGCIGTPQTVTVTVNPIPNANAGADKVITCSSPSVVLNGSSSTGGATFSWAGPSITSGGTTATPTVNAAGTYTLTVTAAGCSFTDQAVVTTNTTLPNANAGSDQVLTCAVTSVVLNGSSSTGGVTYSWAGPSIVSGGTTATPTVNGGGTYTITVTDPTNGCTATDQALVTPSAGIPNVNAGIDKTLTCTIISITLNGSSSTGGATFSWAGPGIVSGGATPTPTVNAAGTYTLTVTDPGNGCSATDQAVVINNTTLPNANAGADQALTCAVTSIALGGSSSTAGATFSWAGPGIVSGGTTQTPTVNAVGTYTLTVTDPVNGCTSTDQAVVSNSSALPNVNAGTDQTLTCSTTSLALAGSSSTVGATFSWAGPGIVSGGTTPSPTINAAGTYTLTVTDPANGCSATDQAVVSNSTALPNANAGSDQTLTCVTTSVVLNGSSTTPGATFSWAGPGIVSNGTTATPTVNAGGTYTITVTDPSNGCTATDQAVVTPSAGIPNVNAGVDKTLTCTVTSIALSGSSSTAGATFSWAGPGIVSGGTTATPTVNAAGTYTLTVTDPANGCTASDQAVINTNTVVPDVNAGADKTLTCATTSIILNGSSTTTGATFSWSGAGIVSGSTTATPTVNAGGFYTLTVTDPANGCTAIDQAAVSADITSPTANAGSDQLLTCTATTVNLDGTGSTAGLTYSWTGGGIVSGAGSTTATANAAGTYTLTVTNPANGCAANDQVVVTSNTTAPNANAGADQILTCAAPSVTLNGSSTTASVTYAWSGPSSYSSTSQTPSVSIAGTYTITVTDPANGCTATDQVVVTPSVGAPNVDAGADQLLTCAVTSLILNGSSATAGVTYNWSGPGIVSGGTTATPTVNTAGTYTLTVTDPSNGCSATDLVTVNTNTTAPTANAGADQTITCSVTTVTLDGSLSTSGMTYSWSGPGGFTSSTQSPTTSATGTYTITVTDPANGCSNTDMASISPSASLPDVNAGVDQVLTCTTLSTMLNGSSTTGGATFSWSGAAIVSGGTTPSPTINGAGTYTLTVTDPSNGCSASDLVNVTSNTTAPTANAGSDQVITCVLTTVPLDGSLSSAGMNYNWSGPGGFTASTQSTTTTTAGTFTLTVTDPANGCVASDLADVTLAAGVPTANAGADQLLTCAVTSVTLDGSLSTAGLNYSWTGPAAFTSTSQSTTTTVAGTYTLSVTNPANGCNSTDIVIVSSNTTSPATIASASNTSFCIGANTTLSASPVGASYTYSWSPATGLNNPGIANPIATPTTTTDYTVTITDGTNGCSASDNILITVSPKPNPVFSSDEIAGCEPLCINFTDHSTISSGTITGLSWNFSDGTATGLAPSHCFATAGTYSIVLTDTSNAGCIATSVIPYTITVNPNPVANFTAPLSTGLLTPVVQYIDQSNISSGSITKWHWNFGDSLAGTDSISAIQNPSHTFSAEGNYCANLIVTSNKGCKGAFNYCIEIEPEFTFYIPNGFSPNDDGNNDEFYGKGENIKTFEMQVYDRWGNLTFYTNDITKHWNGKKNNSGAEPAQQDVYVYIIKLTDNRDKKHKYTGTVTIVK